MHRAVQRGRAGSKQRAAQASQQGNREPELSFLLQRSGLSRFGTTCPDCRSFYPTLSSPQTRYCSQAVTAVPESVLRNLVTTGYYPTIRPREQSDKWHVEGHFPTFVEIQLCAVRRGVWRHWRRNHSPPDAQNDANQRRKRSPIACFMTSPLTSDIALVSGISFGQTSTQFCA